MDLRTILTEDQVIILENTKKQLVIKEIIGCLEKLNKICGANKYYTQVIHRESLENTGVGNGFAIPHARTESVDDYIAVFAKSNTGIKYGSIDKKQVKYLFLSIFPMEKSMKHIYTISIFSRIFSDEGILRQLETANTPKKIYSLLVKNYLSHSITTPQEILYREEFKDLKVPSINLELLLRLDRLYNNKDGNSNEEINSRIEKLKPLIDNRYLTYYERMRKKGRSPFSVLNNDSCTECHMALAPIYLTNLLKSDSIPLCNHCGRILIII